MSRNFEILAYSPNLEQIWESLVAQASMATFMHSRRFLSYHGNRFQDASVLVLDTHQKPVGLLPAAVHPNHPSQVVSHPGLSYGGVVHEGALTGESMVEALECVRQYYAGQGFKSLKYKAIPSIYHQLPASDDLYALFRLGGRRYRCDLMRTIQIGRRPASTQKRRWELKQAHKNGIRVVEGPQYAESLWDVLAENLSRKHQAKPVHRLEEIQCLYQLFPENISFVAGMLEERVVAGLVLFRSPQVVHVQYMASSQEGYTLFALHPVIEYGIEQAHRLGTSYFDFGISNEQEGMILNTGLDQFKAKFGAMGTVQEFYELPL